MPLGSALVEGRRDTEACGAAGGKHPLVRPPLLPDHSKTAMGMVGGHRGQEPVQGWQSLHLACGAGWGWGLSWVCHCSFPAISFLLKAVICFGEKLCTFRFAVCKQTAETCDALQILLDTVISECAPVTLKAEATCSLTLSY